MAQQSKVDSTTVKSNNVDAPFHDEVSKETKNMRSIMAEIGITSSAALDAQSARPKYKYTKAQLVSISKTPAARRRPSFLETAFFNKSGLWDPTKWVQTKWNDSSSQHPEDHKVKPDRTVDLDRDSMIGKRRSSDPKERLKEEQDGIILSPQRRSFGTGCHVIQQPGNARRPESPTDIRTNERDGHREPSRRIGSGRFISRERDRDREREFGYRAGDRRERDDYDREERETREGRITRSRSGKDRRDRGFRRIEEEEEPEWFSGGPTSQSETIELRGFDDFPDDGKSHEKSESKEVSRRERRQSWRKRKTPSIEEVSEKVDEDTVATDYVKARSRPSSETDYTRHENLTAVTDDSVGPQVSEFDFNDLFKMDSIPEIFSIAAATTQESNNGLVGSRFGQFFQQRETSPIQSHSSGTSRRSSFQDELLVPIINQLIDPKVMIPSPTTNSDTYFAPISPAQTTPSNDDATKSLMELLHGTKDSDGEIFAKNNLKNAHIKELAMSGKATSVQELEAGLKSLVLRIQNAPDLDGHERPLPINGQKDDGLNAFKKLLNHISEGQVTLSAQGLPLASTEHCKISQEQDAFQGGGFVSQTLHNNAHLMNVLKNAPTEQDILAGLVKGQPLGVSMHCQMQSPTESGDMLASLLQSSQGSRPSQASASHTANMQHNHLAKVSSCKPLPNNNSYGYDNSMEIVSANHASDKLAAYLGVPNNHMGRQHLQQVGPIQTSVPPTNSIQQQQREILAAILKQQQQQQQQVGQQRQQSPVQPPVIKRPASPPALMSQSSMVNGPISPRVQSPHHSDSLQQSILQQQHARIPSPIVFGQTPPVITHAPSPIHPSQVAQSIAPVANSLNPNTLQVHAPHVMTRVPSPQELRAHTQQIMQNALIKKKLEEQKENYRKRQEMQGPRSPNATRFGESAPLKPPSGMNQTLSIIPTSVMRKMQAGKDKDANKGIQQPNQLQQPPQSSGQPQSQSIGGLADKLAKSKQNILPTSSMGLIQLEEPDKMHPTGIPRTLNVQGFVNGQVPIRAQQVSLAPSLPSQVPLQGRRIVKSNQGIGGQGQRIVPATQLINSQQKQFLSASSNFDVTKQLLLQQQQAVSQRQLNVSPMSSTSALGHPGLPLRGTNLLHAQALNAVRPGVTMAHNNYLLGNMVHPGQTNAQSHFYQLAALQQRGVDPRQIQVPTSLNPLTVPQLFMGVGNAPRGSVPLATGGHSTVGHHHHIHQSASLMNKNDSLFSLTSGFSSATSASFNSLKNVGGGSANNSGGVSGNISKVIGRQSPPSNLDKWFGSNLTQKMPNLPPVPTQRAQYVEEVEQRQQATTVQN